MDRRFPPAVDAIPGRSTWLDLDPGQWQWYVYLCCIPIHLLGRRAPLGKGVCPLQRRTPSPPERLEECNDLRRWANRLVDDRIISGGCSFHQIHFRWRQDLATKLPATPRF